MKLYGLKNCDTCRKARKSLNECGVSVECVDLREEGVPESTLRRFYEAFGDQLLNRRSTTWRSLGEDERSSDPLALMAVYPALIKRPVIEKAGGRLYLGWSREVRKALLD